MTDPELEKLQKQRMEELMRKGGKAERPGHQAEAMPAGVVELSAADFAQTTAKYPLMVVDFWAPWCGPCRMVSPIIEELAKDYAGRVAFGKLNVDDNPVTAQSFGIEGIPTIMMFSRGKAVDTMVGAAPKAAFDSRIRLHLAAGQAPYR